jgi:hypothetical protein
MQVNCRTPRISFTTDRGIASILLLFAMSAFAVLAIGALSTNLGSAAAGKTFSLFRSMPEDAMLKFVAPLVVPNEWRTENAQGSYQFTLPVIVPETGGEERGTTSSWHVMNEIPGMALCCESRSGACNERQLALGGPPIADWTPRADDTLRLAFDLASTPDTATQESKGDVVTATVMSGAAAADGTAVACQLEWDGAVIAKGTAVLRQIARDGADVAWSKAVAGSMTIQVKTK